MKIRIALLVALCMASTTSWADHPIDVERLKAEGKFKEAYIAYQKLPRRTYSSAATLAAAHSAWALGLPDEATQLFDQALSDEKLGEEQKARALIAKGIVQYQEGRYYEAGVIAKQFLEELTVAGPLRVQGWVLWGDSLTELGQLGQAEEKYQHALRDSRDQDTNVEIHFRLGKVHKALGNLSEASGHLKRVPLGDERTAKALRLLGEIYAEQEEYVQSSFWLAKGRKFHSEEFLDSWVDYIFLKGAIEQGSMESVDEIRKEAEKRYPPSDDWHTLLRAEAARYAWLKQGGRDDGDAKARLR